MMKTICLIAAVVSQSLATATSHESVNQHRVPANRPNIVLIVSDDQGYNELNYMNNTRSLHTPNIDALAEGGITLHNWYVQPICSPTRSAMMTGRYPIHIGTQSSVIYWDTPWGVPLEDHMIPHLLKEHSNYHTAMFGKWHLGMYKEDYCPWRRGFDEYRGYLQGCGAAYTHVSSCCTANSSDHDQEYVCPSPTDGEDYRAWDWFNASTEHGFVPDFGANETNSAHLIRQTAVDFLHRMAAQPDPFFLYLPFQNIHSPYTCDPEYYHMYANMSHLNTDMKTLFGYITELDTMIGHIIDALKATELYNNTWIIFTSDNGAPNSPGTIGRNFPLRGHKASLWEGGIRVPAFVHSALLPADRKGTRSNELYHVTDLLPTILDLAGISEKPPQSLDGFSVLESLLTGGPSPRNEILVNVNPLCSSVNDSQANAPRAGLIVGDMKLLVPCFTVAGINGSNSTGPILDPPFAVTVPQHGDNGQPFEGPTSWPMLFNLTDDIAESRNIAPHHLDVVTQMMQRLTQLAETMVEPQQWDAPFQGSNYACADCPKASLGNPNSPGVPWIS